MVTLADVAHVYKHYKHYNGHLDVSVDNDNLSFVYDTPLKGAASSESVNRVTWSLLATN